MVVAPEGKIFRYKNGSYLLVDAQGQIVKGNIPLDGRQVIEEEITKEVADESNLDDSHVGKKYTQVLDKTRAENGIVTFEGENQKVIIRRGLDGDVAGEPGSAGNRPIACNCNMGDFR